MSLGMGTDEKVTGNSFDRSASSATLQSFSEPRDIHENACDEKEEKVCFEIDPLQLNAEEKV